MKILCPRCKQKLTIPDDWAGKGIRCSACNNAFRVPKPKESSAPLPGENPLDLASLAALEAHAGEMDAEELAATQVGEPTEEDVPGTRVCPHCKKRVPSKDPFVELLCSHCWKPIPAVKKAAARSSDRELAYARGPQREAKVGFYEGLGTLFTYPLGALASLLAAVAVAVGAILLPVGVMTALARATEQSQAGSEVFVTHELTGIEQAMMAFFWFEVLFFSAVGIHAFIEVIQTVSVGEEKPPPLVWNPASWGESLGGYVALLVYYFILTYGSITLAYGGEFEMPSNVDQFKDLVQNSVGVLVVLAIGTFLVPMHLIGLGIGKIRQALDPRRIFKSIAATHVNYVFLFLMVLVVGSLYVGLFGIVSVWFSSEIIEMQRAAAKGHVGNVALGLLSWGLVMGFGFFCVYVLGRLHGLFARTFRDKLLFSEI